MSERDRYVLGYRRAEQERLQQQAQQLAHESSALFDQIGVRPGRASSRSAVGPTAALRSLPSGLVPLEALSASNGVKMQLI